MFKHKFLTLFVALFCAAQLFAYDVKIDGIYYNLNTTDNTAEVTNGDYSEVVVIPSTITYNSQTYSVTTIGPRAFEYCNYITSITIPSSVITIGNMAFYECCGLTSVTIPNSVTTIGDYAFYDCSWSAVVCPGLESVTIGNSVTTIGKYAFFGCNGLTSVTIPNSVTTIGESAFYNCYGLESVTIGNSVTTIGESAFYNCIGLTSVTIPSSVTTIGERAFSNCSRLTVTIPNSINSIGSNAFYHVLNIVYHGTATGSPWGAKFINKYVEGYLVYDDNTKKVLRACSSAAKGEITIPSSVTTIGDYAFSGCSGLTSVTIGNSVTTIGDYAFSGCSGLTSVTIGNSVTTIGESAFQKCSSLTSVTIPNSVTTIGDYAFSDCTGLTSVTIENYFTGYQLNSFPSATEVVYANPITINLLEQKMYSAKLSIVIPAIYNEWYSDMWMGEDSNNDTRYKIDAEGIVNIPNIQYDLIPTAWSRSYYPKNFNLYAQKKSGIDKKMAFTLSAKEPTLSCNSFTTQTTITLSNIFASTDETVETLTKGIYVYTDYYNGKHGKHYEADENDCVTLTGLTPNQKCTLQVYGCYNGNYYYGAEKYITTQAIAPTITTSQVAPTSVYVHGSYTHGDATILGTSIACTTTGGSVAGDEGYITGLKPNTTYSFTYSVETNEGGIYTDSKKITTSALELTTLNPKVVSAGTAVVAAETNISDYETNVGFEWRKDNAPTGAASKSSPAIICNGIMEGRLLNLGTEWWRVRPYYEDADGKRYYGKEVYIDPTDFSYFEPTVHTYALATSPTVNKVQVRGYVMTGTDDVTEQGFEYWFNGKKAPRRMPSATPDSVYRVLASGQVMTAVLEDLAYSTTYTCRAYAVAGGETYYGEEVQFLTPEDPRPIYTLTVSADENGSVNETVAGQYREGEQVTLTATPDEGYQFKEWSDGTTDNPYTFTIMSDTTLTATFEELPTALDEVTDSQKSQVESQKVIRDGILYIRRNGKTYDAQGRKL